MAGTNLLSIGGKRSRRNNTRKRSKKTKSKRKVSHKLSSRTKSKAKHRTHTKSSRRKRRRRSRRASEKGENESKEVKDKGPEPSFAICDKQGVDIPKYKDFEAKNYNPRRAAARLARNHLLSKDKDETVDLCIRRKTRGKGHDKVLCYKVTQKWGSYTAKDWMVQNKKKKVGDPKREVRVKADR